MPKVSVSESTHRRLKMAAALEGRSIGELLDRLACGTAEERETAQAAIAGAGVWEKDYRRWGGAAPHPTPREEVRQE